VKQNAETNSKVGAACQADLAVDLIVGCLPAMEGAQKPASLVPISSEGIKPSCVSDLEQPVIS